MPEYKLYYFAGRGLGEVSRQLFHISGTPFEDVRIETDKWPEYKSKTPFGQIPVLLVDGKPLPQSFAIARYLAKEFGMAGKNNFDAAWVDAIADQFKDYISEIRPLVVVLYGFAEGDKDKLKKETGVHARDKLYPILEKRLGESSSGYLVGDSLTWIDLAIADHCDVLLQHLPGFLDGFPKVLALKSKVQSCPKLKSYLEKRPASRF